MTSTRHEVCTGVRCHRDELLHARGSHCLRQVHRDPIMTIRSQTHAQLRSGPRKLSFSSDVFELNEASEQAGIAWPRLSLKTSGQV
eukprot:159764-Amphidinium_carterae.1